MQRKGIQNAGHLLKNNLGVESNWLWVWGGRFISGCMLLPWLAALADLKASVNILKGQREQQR